MDSSRQEEADQRLQEALDRQGARDPRPFYRERLRELKAASPDAYEKAVTHYRDTLVPEVAAGEVDPLEAWMEYGLRLAELSAPGRTVAVDESGRATPYEPDPGSDRLVLHLPEDRGLRPLLVGLPRELSPAQKATFDLLVQGKQTLEG